MTNKRTFLFGCRFGTKPGLLLRIWSFLVLISSFLQAAPAPAPAAPPPPPPAWVPGYRVRFPLRMVGDFTSDARKSESVLARLPAAGWVRADGTDICVQAQDGELLPASVLSHNPTGDTLIQFKRRGNDPLYWAYAGNPKAPAANAPPIPEGLSVEFRDWAGDSLASWADVVAGLKKSTRVLANSFVDLVFQNVNPARPNSPRNFTASYHGWLRIPETGTYTFLLAGEDAAFLFIDGNRVHEQTGKRVFAVRVPASAWSDVDLEAGVHPIEIHHVCGPEATTPKCELLWKAISPKKTKLAAAIVPPEAFAQAALAEVVGVEGAGGATAATFAWGVEDTLSTLGITLYLARFEAQGSIKDPAKIEWDFGDGTKGTGRSPMHVYFKPGEYNVTLRAGPGASPVTQNICMWTAPFPTGPHSLARAVENLTASDWSKWDTQRVNTMFDFLLVSEQPNRWPLVEKLGRHLLAQPDLDVKRRVTLQTTLMEALAEQGRGVEAVQLMDQALKDAGKLPSLRVTALLKAADVQWNYLKAYKEAGGLYEKIVNEHRGLDVPSVREAAIHWGDLFTEAGDMVQAAERYRLAKSLGGERFAATGQTEAIQRGALLRVAEQKLRGGDVRGTRMLLDRIELDFPEQKLEGMYRFLRAEVDRFAGRYENAIRNYEVLLKLRQWAGFRDRAFHGMADCHFRLEDFAKAQTWLEKLQETFPEYFEGQKLKGFLDVVKGRAEHAEAAKNGGATSASETFRGYVTGFEPDETQPPGRIEKISVEPMLGIAGPHVVMIKHGVGMVYTKELRNLPPNGTLWIEFWYREQLCSREVPQWMNVTFQIFLGLDGATKTTADGTQISLERTYGQWRKVATRLRVPLAQDGTIKMTFINAYGVVEIDGLKILPVSDRQNDSLRSFIEAAEIE